MKTKLLTSILAIMLALAASVSAFDSLTVSPSPLNVAEDGTGTVTISITGEDGTEQEPLTVVFGSGLQDTDSTLQGSDTDNDTFNDTWTMTVKPDQDFSGDTNLTVTATNGTQTASKTLVVSVAEEVPTIGLIDKDNQEAVEDKTFSYPVVAADSDNETLKYELAQEPLGMTIVPGVTYGTAVITWTPDEDQLGKHTVTVKVTDLKGALATEEFTVDVRPNKVCEYGVGDNDLDMTVNEPDNNDEFKAGDDMQVEVKVENDGDENMDVVVHAFLYDLDEGKLLKSVKSEEQRIKDKEEENFDLEMTIPTTDFDADSKFMLYVAAYEDEEENCAFKSVPVDLEREDNDVIVTALTLNPETAAPGSKVTATVTVENIGEDDQDGVYVKLRNSYLDLMMETKSFDLEDYKNDDNDNTETVTFELPKDVAEGEYWIDAVVYFDNGREQASQVTKLVVKNAAAKAQTTEDLPTLTLTPETGLAAKAGKKLAVPVVITNKGTSAAEFTLEVSDVDSWAKVLAIEQPGQLNAGESGHAYVYLETKADAPAGAHDLSLNLRNSLGLLATKKVSVSLEGQAAEPAQQTTANRMTGLFTAGSSAANLFWTVGAVVLAIVGLFFLRTLLKK